MTLERHKGKTLVGVGLSPDGRLLVADEGGMLDIKGGTLGRSHNAIPSFLFEDDDNKSNLSSKSKKSANRTSIYSIEMSKLNVPATGSMRSSIISNTSMQRKIKHMKKDKRLSDLPDVIQGGSGDGLWDDYKAPNKFDSIRAWSSIGKYHKKNEEALQYHAYAASYAGSMDRVGKEHKELDMESIKRYKKQQLNNRRESTGSSSKRTSGKHKRSSGSHHRSSGSHKRSSTGSIRHKSKELKLSEEKLPGIIFIIISIILLALAIVKIVVSYWHSYFCALWTGLIILMLGLVGASHKGNYFSRPKNIAYTILAMLSSVCAILTVAFSMAVFYPMTVQMVLENNSTELMSMITFSNMGKSLAIQIAEEKMVLITVVIDGMIIIVSSASLFSMTASMVSMNNHWEAVHKFTGECNHRGIPSSFNPVYQVLLGLITLYLAVINDSLWVSSAKHLYFIFISPIFIIVVGYINLCHGKRPDIRKLELIVVAVDGILILCIAITVIFVVFGLVSELTIMDEFKNGTPPGILPITKDRYVYAMFSIVADVLYILISLINIIFTVGMLFRTGKNLLAPNTQNKKNGMK